MAPGIIRFEKIVISDVGNPNDEDSHLTASSMNDTGRDVHDGAGKHWMFRPIKGDGAVAFEDVIDLL